MFIKGSVRQKITTTNLDTLIKAVLIGFVCTESWYLSKAVGSRLNEYITGANHGTEAIVICTIGLLLIIGYMLVRRLPSSIGKVLRSGRVDVFVALSFGILISKSFAGVGTGVYTKMVSALTIGQLLTLVALPLVLGFSLLLRAIQISFAEKRGNVAPFFISDVEQKLKKDDLLGFSEQAERFAERVLNQGSSESMVFGIDAPWGIGKSTFVNFCKEWWENNHEEKAIVYSFNPIRYDDRTNLLIKFVDGLIRAIQKHSFVPEIRPLISEYSQFIQRAKWSLSVFGFEILPGTYTIDDAFEDLKTTLLSVNNKIIIVVDDLDRLNFSAIKNVLFAIKMSFTLPNISYVLCYDTENINSLENKKTNIEKVSEFLEKFVNVKVSLYIDSVVLKSYISENLQKALAGNSQADPILVSKAAGGLIEIFNSVDYHRYLPFIGDVRKLKRLINTLLLLGIEKTDFDNSDFNSQDLIHLLLIYINYPSIFRKIYNTETQGKRGFFSVVAPFDNGYPKNPQGQGASSSSPSTYKNSTDYTEYVISLQPNQRFLLNKVFDVSYRLDKAVIDSIPQEIKHSLACFNGGWADGKNLEEYLNLIVKLSKPQKHTQYRFYLNCKNDIVRGKTVEEVLSQEAFSYSKSETSHEQFWRVITNSPHELDSATGAKLITYLLNNIQNYSLFTNKDIGVGLRDDLDFILVKLLDAVGWSDQKGQHRQNTDENIREIAQWIFGEGKHAGGSIIEILSKEDRGVLGFFDLLAFRLSCSADRGGDTFNLQRALLKHGDPKTPTEGSTTNLAIEEMREISQRVFQRFESQYISKNKNLFELADNLSLTDFTGKYRTFIEDKIASGDIKDAEASVAGLRSRVTSFITYQMGNSLTNMGVGCGKYDPTGKENNQGIKKSINEYLFNECFNPAINSKNYEYFINYLLKNFISDFESEAGRDWVPNTNEITKVLERERIVEYWKKNAKAIKDLKFIEQNKVVFTVNYVATYKENLEEVYKMLDKLVNEIEQGIFRIGPE